MIAIVLLDGDYACKKISESGMKGGVVLLRGQSHGRSEEALHRKRIAESLKAFHGAAHVSCQPTAPKTDALITESDIMFLGCRGEDNRWKCRERLLLKGMVISEAVFLILKKKKKKEGYSPRATLATRNRFILHPKARRTSYIEIATIDNGGSIPKS